MTGYNRGRATTYKGVRMRSRLEASFAAWLDDNLDVEKYPWAYEPVCFADAQGQYLPDFRVERDDGTRDYFEVKPPTADTSAALIKMHVIRASEPRANFYVVVPTGNYPNQGWAMAGQCETSARCAHCLGGPFVDLRTVPHADRAVPTDPATGRATIGGRARHANGAHGRPTIGGRARRETRPVEPTDNCCGQCNRYPCVCREVDPHHFDDEPGAWCGI